LLKNIFKRRLTIASPINPLNQGVFTITINMKMGIRIHPALNTETNIGILKPILSPYDEIDIYNDQVRNSLLGEWPIKKTATVHRTKDSLLYMDGWF
jgi:hypothetical protein